jgi:hypothetical protein
MNYASCNKLTEVYIKNQFNNNLIFTRINYFHSKSKKINNSNIISFKKYVPNYWLTDESFSYITYKNYLMKNNK